jgi:hypothetical protein
LALFHLVIASVVSVRHGVVAAGMKGVTAGDAPRPHPAPFKKAETGDGLEGILGTGGGKTAIRWQNPRNGKLIKPN